MMLLNKYTHATVMVCFLASVATGSEDLATDFARQVQPILAEHCYACHGPDESAGGLMFTDRDAVLRELDSGAFAVVTGKPDLSELLKRVTHDDEFMRMPPESDPLSPEDVEILRGWIEEGAPWSEHWRFRAPRPIDPPQVNEAEWNNHPIDAFIYARLSSAGLAPNPPSDRRTLIRRASYGLTGLPPGATDKPIAGLLQDLKDRGLLDETLVVWGGEFGRQPTAEYAKGTGRDHNSYGFNMWMAGGGIKGGVCVGATDDIGSAAVERPLHVKNLHATVLHQLGLDPNQLAYFHGGLDKKLVGVEHVEPIHEIVA